MVAMRGAGIQQDTLFSTVIPEERVPSDLRGPLKSGPGLESFQSGKELAGSRTGSGDCDQSAGNRWHTATKRLFDYAETSQTTEYQLKLPHLFI